MNWRSFIVDLLIFKQIFAQAIVFEIEAVVAKPFLTAARPSGRSGTVAAPLAESDFDVKFIGRPLLATVVFAGLFQLSLDRVEISSSLASRKAFQVKGPSSSTKIKVLRL